MRYSLSSLASVAVVCAITSFAQQAIAASTKVEVTVEAGKHDRENLPVTVNIELPAALKDAKLARQAGGARGPLILGQITKPGLSNATAKKGNGTVARELHFILPQLKSGQAKTLVFEVSDSIESPEKQFSWKDDPGKTMTLLYAGKPVLRYMYEKLDESSKARREETYKVFHHVFDPEGDAIVTKGPGGRYTHHRGLYYGFSRCSYGKGKRADTWHSRGKAHQAHKELEASEAGPVLGRHQIAIAWHGQDGEEFASEQREITVYHLPGGNLIEAASKLHGVELPVKVDGDPQHAGFQFRASQEVAAKTSKQPYYVRPDGVGEKGKTRNWPGNKTQKNLPWAAISFVLGDQRFTCARLAHPANPKPTMHSERDYGRFGSYFVDEIKEKDDTIDIGYRFWIQRGEMTVDEAAALSNDFTDPVKVTAKIGE
ncbi:MAG: PmoA family protein [Pirellulales bacterium]|nr:PmoA family protein [Pirellulales bacterium]